MPANLAKIDGSVQIPKATYTRAGLAKDENARFDSYSGGGRRGPAGSDGPA